MEFTQVDRDMLKAHDAKLIILCSTSEKMDKTLDKIDENIGKGAVVCVERRAECRKEIDDKFVRTKTFWSVISVIILGFLAKVFLIK